MPDPSNVCCGEHRDTRFCPACGKPLIEISVPLGLNTVEVRVEDDQIACRIFQRKRGNYQKVLYVYIKVADGKSAACVFGHLLEYHTGEIVAGRDYFGIDIEDAFGGIPDTPKPGDEELVPSETD